MLISEARVRVADPARLAADLTAHMVEHEVTFVSRGGRTVATLGSGTAALEATPRSLDVRLEADDLGEIEMMRSVIATHIVEFAAGETPSIVWTGIGGAGADTFANFREIRLIAAKDLTPRMRRLTFSGERLDGFATDADLHVRLYFPPAGLASPEWPRPGADGRTLWPAEERRPAARYYTIRAIRPEAGEIDIDFLLHDESGPGSAFASAARPGAICGMIGPLGRCVGAAAFRIFAGDETALPAIARMVEALPADAAGVALIEVEGAADEIAIAAPSGVEVRWLHRGADDEHDVSTSPLLAAMSALAFPDGDDVFVWAGCEFAVAKALRKHLKVERQLEKARQLVVGYWSVEDDD